METLRRLIDTPAWQAEAKCLGMPPGAFYSDGSNAEVQWAKRFCKGQDGGSACPVLADCLDYAMDNEEKHGVWGGTSERERRRLKKARLTR